MGYQRCCSGGEQLKDEGMKVRGWAEESHKAWRCRGEALQGQQDLAPSLLWVGSNQSMISLGVQQCRFRLQDL